MANTHHQTTRTHTHTHTHTSPHHMCMLNPRSTLKTYPMMIYNGVVHGKSVEYCHMASVISTHIMIIDGKPAEYANLNDIVISDCEHASPNHTHTHLTTPNVPDKPAECTHHGPCKFESHRDFRWRTRITKPHTRTSPHHMSLLNPRSTLAMVLVHLNNIVISDGEHALPNHTHTPHHTTCPCQTCGVHSKPTL